ncbi:MAG: hypothetical protein DLM60_09030 [Pseudonocardiales bacterium]|nr:MAG: hypothetical protein DLM60_09030 [Pseudonocardiales bacterium]
MCVRPRACRRVARRGVLGAEQLRGESALAGGVPTGLPTRPGGALCGVDRRSHRWGGPVERVRAVHAHPVRGRGAPDRHADQTLITLAYVVGFDETTLRVGPAGHKRYVLSASTEDYTALHLGGRDLPSFREFGILPAFAGVAVHDRYQNYYNPAWAQLAGHQACTAHLLRDFTDAAESHPRAVCPRAGPARVAWADPRLARRPRRRTHGDPSAPRRPADQRVPPRHPSRPRRSPTQPRPPQFHRPAARTDSAGVLPRPPRRRPGLLHRHPHLAHQQPQRTRLAARQDPTEDLRSAHQRGRHPGPPRHPQLHRHHPQTQSRRHHRHPRRADQRPLATTDPRANLTDAPSQLTRRHPKHGGIPACPRNGT